MISVLTRKNNVFTTFLNCLGIKYTDQYADKLFNEHPHKYDLFGLSKMLSEYEIENKGIRISDKEKSIHDMEAPFIAHIGSDFVVVYKTHKDKISYIWQKKDITIQGTLINMKKLRKIQLHDAAILSDNEMKMVFGGSGGSGSGEKVCDYIQCYCTHGMALDSGTPQLGGSWRENCDYDMRQSGIFDNHCEKKEGGCYRVYKEKN
jgi:natural product precursor